MTVFERILFMEHELCTRQHPDLFTVIHVLFATTPILDTVIKPIVTGEATAAQRS